MADQLAENLKSLAPYGYKKGADETLQTQVTAYGASLPGAGTARGEDKLGTGTVRAVF